MTLDEIRILVKAAEAYEAMRAERDQTAADLEIARQAIATLTGELERQRADVAALRISREQIEQNLADIARLEIERGKNYEQQIKLEARRKWKWAGYGMIAGVILGYVLGK